MSLKFLKIVLTLPLLALALYSPAFAAPAQTAPDTTPGAISVLSHIVTGSIGANGVPGPAKSSFSPQDARVCSHVQLTGRLGGQQLNWKYINPQSAVHMQGNLRLPNNTNVAWSCLSIAGRGAAKLLGNWSVQLWIDGTLQFTDPFRINSLAQPDQTTPIVGLQVIQHVMTRTVNRTPCCSVSATSSFLASDNRAVSFVELRGDYTNKRLRWEFTDPTGYVMTTEADARSRYHWAWISLSNRSASSVTGNWTTKFYINNALQFTDSFTVTATSAAGLGANIASDLSLRPVNANSAKFRLDLADHAVDAAQIQIFDMQGRRVFDSGFQTGQSLSWSALDSVGNPLANGVYFYVVTARDAEGKIVSSGIKKIRLLR